MHGEASLVDLHVTSGRAAEYRYGRAEELADKRLVLVLDEELAPAGVGVQAGPMVGAQMAVLDAQHHGEHALGVELTR